MSLFAELQKGELIPEPKNTGNYRKILNEQKETEEEKVARKKREWKELCEQKRKEMPMDEYTKWRKAERYKRNRKKQIKKYDDMYWEKKKEEEEMMEEIYKYVYDDIPEPVDIDKYYSDKYRPDDLKSGRQYLFSWRASRIRTTRWDRMSVYKKPVRIVERSRIDSLFTRLGAREAEAYQILLPYKDELKDWKFIISHSRQIMSKYPKWIMDENIKKIVNSTDLAPSHICTVADAMKRDKYIASELYLGRSNFILGDVIVTQTGNLFRISLDNNINWLNRDTIEEIHQERIDFLKGKIFKMKHLYMLPDAYFLKIPINERQNLYYIVPT